jgi:hypothetical protein
MGRSKKCKFVNTATIRPVTRQTFAANAAQNSMMCVTAGFLKNATIAASPSAPAVGAGFCYVRQRSFRARKKRGERREKMQSFEDMERIEKEIVDKLAAEGCTIVEAEKILREAGYLMERTTLVQRPEVKAKEGGEEG